MYKLALLVLLALVSASQGFSEKKVGQLSAPDLYSKNSPLGIFKGKKTIIEKFPYLVAVHVNKKYTGAAPIVSRRWVLLDPVISSVPMQEITLVAGSSDGYTGKKYSLKTLVVHPKISGFDYDYGLAQIKGKFNWSKKTKPIKLATKQPKVNTPMVVASWGATGVVSNSSLTQGTMKWMSKKACKAAYHGFPGIPFTSPRLGCVYNKGKTTTCSGDWSAPFVSKSLLYGYVVYTYPTVWCSTSAKPVVVANVPTVAAWIKKITGAKTEDDDY